MRPQVIVIVLLAAALAGALVCWKGGQSRKMRPAPVEAAPAADTPSSPVVTASDSKPARASANSPAVPASSPATNSPAVTAQKVEELQSLAMNNDAASLNVILAALTDSDPQIRAAAREAAIQFGDASAAVRLREVAAQTEDVAEKNALLEAAKYLELPSLPATSSTNLHPSKLAHPARPGTQTP
jgi:hypothetical protein